MKVAFVTAILDDPSLDAATSAFFHSLCRLQGDRGHTVRVFTLGDDDRDETRGSVMIHRRRFRAEAFRGFENGGQTPVFGGCVSRALALHETAKAQVAEFSPDILQCVRPLDVIGWVAEARLPIALVSVTPQFERLRRTPQGTFTPLDTALVTGLETMVVGVLDAIAVPSQEMAAAFRECTGRIDTTVYPHAIDGPPPAPEAMTRFLEVLARTAIDRLRDRRSRGDRSTRLVRCWLDALEQYRRSTERTS